MTPRTIWILPVVDDNGEAVFYVPRALSFPEKTICAFVNRWMSPEGQVRVVSAPFVFPARIA